MRSRLEDDLDSCRPLILFLGDERDDEDHDVLFPKIRESGVSVVRVHPIDLMISLEPSGPRFTVDGRPVRPKLVVGWVLDELLWPGMIQLDVFERACIPVINDTMTLFRTANKLLDSSQLNTGGLLRYPVLSGYDRTALDPGFAPDGTTVVKPLRGFGGRGIERLESTSDYGMFRRMDTSLDSAYYAMPWVESPGRDIRIYTVNHHPVFAMYRYAPPGSWITNVTAGGRIAMCPLTAELSDLASRASRAANTLIGGVDIGEDVETGGYVIYEVNSCPTCEPPVLEMVADFLTEAVTDYEAARATWEPSHVYTTLDRDPKLFHPSKRHLIQPAD